MMMKKKLIAWVMLAVISGMLITPASAEATQMTIDETAAYQTI